MKRESTESLLMFGSCDFVLFLKVKFQDGSQTHIEVRKGFVLNNHRIPGAREVMLR